MTKIFDNNRKIFHAASHVAMILISFYAASAIAKSSAKTFLLLTDAVELAVTNHPGLAALEATTRAMATLPSQVSALPDPVLSVNAMNLPTNTFDLDQEPMTQIQIAISQRLPFPGKRELRQATAHTEVRAADARREEQRNTLIAEIRSAWWRLFSLDRTIELVAHNKDLMRDFIEIAQSKYTVGRGLQQDVLLAQLELSRVLEREIHLKGQRRSGAAALNGLLSRHPQTSIVLAQSPLSTELPVLPGIDELIGHAHDSRDLLAVHRNLLAAAQSRTALAKRDRYPDFKVGAGYGIRSGDYPIRGGNRADFFSVMFSINLPVYSKSKQNEAVMQRISEQRQHTLSLDDSYRAIKAEIGGRLAVYQSAKEQVDLLNKTIVPQAQQTANSMLAGYQVNEVDFLNVVNGQLMLFNAQISYWFALSEAKQSLSKLAATVGMESLYE